MAIFVNRDPAAPGGPSVLDIGLLTFLDSTALSLFISQHKKLRSQGSKLVIYPGAPHGMCSTLKDRVNEELLRFIGESMANSAG